MAYKTYSKSDADVGDLRGRRGQIDLDELRAHNGAQAARSPCSSGRQKGTGSARPPYRERNCCLGYLSSKRLISTTVRIKTEICTFEGASGTVCWNPGDSEGEHIRQQSMGEGVKGEVPDREEERHKQR